jgi:hypothetical protein
MLNRIICCLILAGPPGLSGIQAQANFAYQGTNAVLIFDVDGKPFENLNSNVVGTPFLRDDWRLGRVITSTNKQYDSVKLRFNLQTQEFHFLNKDSVEIAIFKGYVKEVRFYDGIPGMTGANAEFQAGFPAIDEQDGNSFYLVLCKGKISLLKCMRKVLSRGDNLFNGGEVKREYISHEDYYSWDGKVMQKIKKDKSALLSLLADQQTKVGDFINSNHLKLKSVDEVRRVIDYYNSL